MTSAQRLGAAGLARLRGELDVRDMGVLHDVSRCRLMTGRQLQLLHVGGDESAARAARRRLARLVAWGLLVRLERRVGGLRAGSSGYVYTLSAAGHRLLHPGDYPRRRRQEVRDGFAAHTLAIADVYLRLKLAHQRGDIELQLIETEPRCWRRFQDIGGLDWLKPDLHVVIAVGDDILHSFVEVDRGTEHSPALLRKLRQYEAAYRSGSVGDRARLHYRGDSVFPRVVWLVPSETRADLVRQLCRSSGLTADLHVVALQADALTVLADCRDVRGGPP